MNKRQKIAVTVGVTVAALMLLVPPWQQTGGGVPIGDFRTPVRQMPAGYGPLFYPPKSAERIDLSRLAVQCAVVAVLTFGLYVLVGHKPKD